MFLKQDSSLHCQTSTIPYAPEMRPEKELRKGREACLPQHRMVPESKDTSLPPLFQSSQLDTGLVSS